MNEELKIIITAITTEAKKNIQGVKKELGGVASSAKGASAGIGSAMAGIGIAAVAAIAAIAAVGGALVKLGKATLDFQKAQAKLNTAFLSAGSTAQQAAESYKGLFRFMGDADTSAEAAAHLAKLTTGQKELAEWTKICQGVYATFGDSLKIESLTEAANETAKVGRVTGTMADALNWAGVSEDEFNAKLARTTSYEEREALIRSTLNGLYSNAAEIYEKNNKQLLDYNESQARLDSSMAAAGQAVLPLMTALNNLSAVLFEALKPAIDVIVPALAAMVNWVTQGIQAVMGLFGAVTGASTSITSMAKASAGIGSAANGADNLASGLDDAAKAAEKAKRATMGFDELNVVSSGSSSSGSAGAGASAPGYLAPNVGAQNFTMEVEQTEGKASGLVATMKKIAADLKDTFAPTIKAWSSGFETIKQSWDDSKGHFVNGGLDIIDSLVSIGSYVQGDFVPSLINSFSTNLAPVITDVLGFAIKELGKTFETLGYITKDTTEALVIPALDIIKEVQQGIFKAIGDAWADKGAPVLAALSEALDHIRSVIVALYEESIKPITDKLNKTISSLWKSSLEPLYRKVVDAILEISMCILQLYNEFLAPIVNWILKNIVPLITNFTQRVIEHLSIVVSFIASAVGGAIDHIKGIIQFIVGVFTGDWEKAWEGVKNIFKGLWDAIAGIVQAVWETIKYPFREAVAYFGDILNLIKNNFSGVAEWFGGIFTKAYDKIIGAFKNVKSGFANVWANIKAGFGNVGDWFKNTFTTAWNNVKNVFSTGGKIFDGIKDGILNGLKTIINALISGINKVIKVPFDGINSALKTVKNVEILGFKPFNGISTISVPQIPKLAKGGIIDRATLALVGEQGKEAVVPLENNTGWIDKLVDKLAARQSGPEKIVLMLDGRELGWANIKSINNITRQTGALQLTLV